ncbi:MAG: hypothetical protein IMY77_00270 [Chloroflexi bacterium]|nr:hypothetical protein [Chloroflexota bacterium]
MKQDWLCCLYKTMWSRVGRRPWTYIIRDSYHRKPLLWLGLATGIGILLGHIFWGTPWVPGQLGN